MNNHNKYVKTTALGFLMKLEKHNIVEDEVRPFIQINDKDVKKKPVNIEGVRRD